MSGKSGSLKDAELHPDAWSRFEHAIDVVAKSPPQHKIKADKGTSDKKPKKPKRRSS
jgi:hypothetical protein